MTAPGLHAVFLDRDGVINKVELRAGRPHPPAGVAQLELLDGVADAIRIFKRLGLLVVVVTNQPDVARGITSREEVQRIHAELARLLPIDRFETCYHDDSDRCACRKPLPGLLTQAAQQLGIDLAGSFMVGDRWRDVEAGQAAGCRTFFIDCQYAERRPDHPDFTVPSLLAASGIIQSILRPDGLQPSPEAPEHEKSR
jgi:D-glycero-D-manno-heptose 1,7-bisphosphate phosphatase